MTQNLAVPAGHASNCWVTDLSIVDDARYAARNEGANWLLRGFSGCSIIAWAKKLRWMNIRTGMVIIILGDVTMEMTH